MDNSKKKESTGKESDDQQTDSTLEELFKGFSTSQDKESDVKMIDMEGVKKWFKQANISQVSSDDVKAAFSKKAGSKKQLSIGEFNDMIKELAKEKKLQEKEVMHKIKSVNVEEQGKGMIGSIKDFFCGSGKQQDEEHAKEDISGKGSQKDNIPSKGQDEKSAKGYQPGTGPPNEQDETDSKEKDALQDITKSPPDRAKDE